MRKKLSVLALFSHSLLQASDFGTIFMSATLFVLLITLLFSLMVYLKNLQKENLRLKTLFDHSKTPTLFVNSRGIVQDLNNSALSFLGFSKARLTGQNWFDRLIADEHALVLRHQVHQHLRKDEERTLSAPVIRSDGTLVEINITLTPLPEPLKGFILTLADDTKREVLMDVQKHLKES